MFPVLNPAINIISYLKEKKSKNKILKLSIQTRLLASSSQAAH